MVICCHNILTRIVILRQIVSHEDAAMSFDVCIAVSDATNPEQKPCAYALVIFDTDILVFFLSSLGEITNLSLSAQLQKGLGA